jgi:hypothetical protein
MLTADDPTYPNWDQDTTAEDDHYRDRDRDRDRDHYRDRDPVTVAGELTAAAGTVAAAFATVEGAAWDRRGTRSDGAAFTVASFGCYMIHDPVHHLHDVTVDLATPTS